MAHVSTRSHYGWRALLVLLLSWIVHAEKPAWRTYYEVLDVPADASIPEIRRAYRRVALLEHPDKSTRQDAEARFRLVAEAFEVLSNERKRRQYDEDLAAGQGGVDGGQRGGVSVDAYELFRNHMGNVYQHWQPGDVVEGDIIRNDERIRIVIRADGSSEEKVVKETNMHRFKLVGTGWCLFDGQPQMMTQENIDEISCRKKCVDMAPSCEAYGYERGSDWNDGYCEIYRRSEPPKRVAGIEKTEGVSCYQQDDAAFDTASSLLQSEVKVTRADGSVSGFSTTIFCQHRKQYKQIMPKAERPEELPWWQSVARSVGRLIGAFEDAAGGKLSPAGGAGADAEL
eukprot:TRINITY_DN112854_c0_g1_i1.p1 TRINITY_DN112854_c0_g1~~TRINITY_DN112854_c0_g1_i1.p1  ORF type:complete len:342 (+),score=87.22 TRINITY_DN112854_c0_g1_i1:3-1028(+)